MVCGRGTKCRKYQRFSFRLEVILVVYQPASFAQLRISSRRSQPKSVNRKYASGPRAKVDTGYMIPAAASSRWASRLASSTRIPARSMCRRYRLTAACDNACLFIMNPLASNLCLQRRYSVDDPLYLPGQEITVRHIRVNNARIYCDAEIEASLFVSRNMKSHNYRIKFLRRKNIVFQERKQRHKSVGANKTIKAQVRKYRPIFLAFGCFVMIAPVTAA